MSIEERYSKIIEIINHNKTILKTELKFNNPFELLVAVILSAQCTDKRVNIITPYLLKKYPSPEIMSTVNYNEIFELIKTCSYPNSKSKYLVEMSKTIVKEFDGKVPSSMDELLTIPGVGRKTANVILAVAFDKPAMAVDTHVFRVSNRIGLTTNSKTPEKTEKELLKYIPENLLNAAHHWLILHGRYICIARKPKCNECLINNYCSYFTSNFSHQDSI